MSLAYLAQPIDLAARDGSAWSVLVEHEVSRLTREGFAVYRPARAWSVAPSRAQACGARVQGINMQILAEVDLLVAVVPPKCSTIGVWIEVAYAVVAGIKVEIITDQETVDRSFVLAWLAAEGATIRVQE